MRLILLLTLLLPLTLLAQPALDAPAPEGLRPGGTLSQELEAPPIFSQRSTARRPARNWPQQPPLIPHGIRGYQVDKSFNQCLTCHSRSAAEISGALMVSITHFSDRDGQPLAAVSPRRYFCLACHVPQYDTEPVSVSTFINIDQVLQQVIEQAQ